MEAEKSRRVKLAHGAAQKRSILKAVAARPAWE